MENVPAIQKKTRRAGKKVQAARALAAERRELNDEERRLLNQKKAINRSLNRVTGSSHYSKLGQLPSNSGEKAMEHLLATRAQIRTNAYDVTPDGVEWLKVAFNPCDTSARNRGYPDMETAPVVTPSERERFDISPGLTPTITTGTFNEAELWNVVIISDPSVMCTFFLIYQGSVGSPTYTGLFTNQDRIRTHMQTAGIACSRVTAYGTTIEFTGPTIADQGAATHVQLKQNWKQVTEKILTTAPPSTQFYRAWSLNDTNPRTANPAELFDFLREMMESDPASVSMAAKEGAYFVHKLNEPALMMKKHTYAGGINIDKAFALNPFYTAYFGTDQAEANFELAQTELYADEGYSWNAAVTWMTGLSTQATLSVKKYVHLECQVTPRSELRYYTHAAPRVDEKAQHAYNRMAEELPSAFPSSYNAFGWLKKAFNWVVGAGKKVISVIKPIKDI